MSRAELVRLKAMVEEELYRRDRAAEEQRSSREVVQERPTPRGTLRLELVRCGKKECKKCAEGPAHGPYWYLYVRRGGRLTSKYLGKELPEGMA